MHEIPTQQLLNLFKENLDSIVKDYTSGGIAGRMPKVLDVRVESALTIFHNGTDNLGELGLDVTEARREAHAYLKEKLNTLVIGHTLLRKYQSTYHF